MCDHYPKTVMKRPRRETRAPADKRVRLQEEPQRSVVDTYPALSSVFQQELTRDRNGRLERVTLRFIENARTRRMSELTRLRHLDSALRLILRREFTRYFYPLGRGNSRNVLEQVYGYLGASSTVSNRYSRMQVMRASELTYSTIQNYLLETIQQSNEEANMTNLEWTFYVSPQTYQQGGAGKITTRY